MKGVWALSIVLAFVAGSILTGSMAYAVPNGQPFQALWDAITDLQGQIDTIELTPGPQGETGPQGATGPAGDDATSDVTIKHVTILDDAAGNALGWNPPASSFEIIDSDVVANSIVTMYVQGDDGSGDSKPMLGGLCDIIKIKEDTFTDFDISLDNCNDRELDEGTQLHYVVITPKPLP